MGMNLNDWAGIKQEKADRYTGAFINPTQVWCPLVCGGYYCAGIPKGQSFYSDKGTN